MLEVLGWIAVAIVVVSIVAIWIAIHSTLLRIAAALEALVRYWGPPPTYPPDQPEEERRDRRA